MKKKTNFASMLTCLLLMATSLAFAQNNSVQSKKSANASTKAVIESVTPNLSHHCIYVTLANLDPQGEYYVLLYNSGKELIMTYSVEGNEMTLFVGGIAPSDYEIVLLKGKEVVDQKKMLLQ